MGNLLDFGNQVGGGLMNLLTSLGQAPAVGGANGQIPQVDPALAQMAGPGALDAARANYMRNLQAGMQEVAAHGGSLGMMMNAPGVAAGGQYSNEVRQAASDAMQLRMLRMAQDAQGGATGDPFAQMNAGAAMSFVSPQAGAAMQNAAKEQIGPAELAYNSAQREQRNGNSDGAFSYYVQFLKATGRLDVNRSGVMTLLGGVTPADLKYISIDPSSGTITGPAGQTRIPGSNSATEQRAAANARGTASTQIAQIDAGNGSTQQMPQLAAVAQLGGNPGAGAPPPVAAQGTSVSAPPQTAQNPALQPVAPTGQRIGAQPQQPQIPPELRNALGDTSYRTDLPVGRLGQSLTPAMKAQQDKLTAAENDLRAEGDEATKGAAATLTYIKAAQAVMASPGGVPTGLSGPMAAAVSRAMAAVGMGAGDYAAKSQLLVKYLGNLALSNAKATYGPRITQNEVRLQLEELSPSQAMQNGTINEMLDKLGRISQYAIDSADRSRYYLQGRRPDGLTLNNPLDFAKWNQAHFPMAEETTPAADSGLPAGWTVKVH